MKAKALLLLVPSALMLIGCNGDVTKSSETPEYVETDLTGAKARLEAIKTKVNADDFVLPTKGVAKRDARLKMTADSSETKEGTIIQNAAFDLDENDPYLHSYCDNGDGKTEETWLYKNTSGKYIAAYDINEVTVDESGASQQTNTKTSMEAEDSTEFMTNVFNPAVKDLEVDKDSISKTIKETPSSMLESLEAYEQSISSSAATSNEGTYDWKFYLGKDEGDFKMEVTATVEASDGTITTVETKATYVDYMLVFSYVDTPFIASSHMILEYEYKWGEVEKTYPEIADFLEAIE